MCGHSLPNFQRLVELLGESSALLLCWKRGGRTVYISGRDAGALGEIIGPEGVAVLRKEMRGRGAFAVPLGPLSFTGGAAVARELVSDLEFAATFPQLCATSFPLGCACGFECRFPLPTRGSPWDVRHSVCGAVCAVVDFLYPFDARLALGQPLHLRAECGHLRAERVY